MSTYTAPLQLVLKGACYENACLKSNVLMLDLNLSLHGNVIAFHNVGTNEQLRVCADKHVHLTHRVQSAHAMMCCWPFQQSGLWQGHRYVLVTIGLVFATDLGCRLRSFKVKNRPIQWRESSIRSARGHCTHT